MMIPRSWTLKKYDEIETIKDKNKNDICQNNKTKNDRNRTKRNKIERVKRNEKTRN